MSITPKDITAVILAGGQGRRMGGQDKGLIEFNGKTLVSILIDRLATQSIDIVINANRNQERYLSMGYPVIKDQLEDYQGPLAGFASAMSAVTTDYIVTLPCDGPLLVSDYIARFHRQQRGDRCVYYRCPRRRSSATGSRVDQGRPVTESAAVS